MAIYDDQKRALKDALSRQRATGTPAAPAGQNAQAHRQAQEQALSVARSRQSYGTQKASQGKTNQQQALRDKVSSLSTQRPRKLPKTAQTGLVNRQVGSPRYGKKYNVETRPDGSTVHVYADGTRIAMRDAPHHKQPPAGKMRPTGRKPTTRVHH